MSKKGRITIRGKIAQGMSGEISNKSRVWVSHTTTLIEWFK